MLLTGLIVVCLFPVTRGFAQEETDTAYFRNVSAKLILECFKQAREAVLLQDAVLCWPSGTGRAYLDRKTPQPETEDVETICKNARAAPGADRRVLDRRVINDVISLAKNAVIDTRGIRIIGGIYCSTIDLTGIDIPYSLVLDRSIVWGGNIETRNFRTGGDFSVDYSVIYGNLRIVRADIAGSLWAQHAFLNHIQIEDTNIKGAININHALIPRGIEIENLNIQGDLDVSNSYFSDLAILKTRASGLVDIGETQARCTYEVRSNEFGDFVAVDIGFGTSTADTQYRYIDTKRYYDAYRKFYIKNSKSS